MSYEEEINAMAHEYIALMQHETTPITGLNIAERKAYKYIQSICAERGGIVAQQVSDRAAEIIINDEI